MGKNHLIKRVKISRRKFSVIVRCFSTDITANSCAQIVKINRNTANRYYQYFRELILKDQEEERRRFLSKDETEIDEAYFG